VHSLAVRMSVTAAAAMPVVGSVSLAGGQCDAEWARVSLDGPSPRNSMGMVFDERAGGTLLFSGLNENPRNDTWFFADGRWTQLAPSGPLPAARSAMAMAYDAGRDGTVMYGGADDSGSMSDTWEWNGSAWTSVPVTGPGARLLGSMVYDRARQVCVLFGGSDGNTWIYDGIQWTRAATTGPGTRFAHQMTYDDRRERTILFGGTPDAIVALGDTWEWNGSMWMRVQISGPQARFAGSLSYDSVRQRCVLFGGVGRDPGGVPVQFSDTWEWDGTTWTQLAINGPFPRLSHATTYDRVRGEIVLFGGTNGAPLGDTWILPSRPPVDFNRDDFIDSRDFFDYLTAFFTMPACPEPCSPPSSSDSCPADYNRDCVVDSADLFEFLEAFLVGC